MEVLVLVNKNILYFTIDIKLLNIRFIKNKM